MEVSHHILFIATSYKIKILCTVIQAYCFVTFLSIGYDEKWALQVSDDRIIVIRFMTKKYVFVAEDLLWYGIDDEPIFVMQMS